MLFEKETLSKTSCTCQSENIMSAQDIIDVYEEELEAFGILRNYRYAGKDTIPTRNRILVQYYFGRLIFKDLPKENVSIYIVIDKNRLEILTNLDENIRQIYSGVQIIEVEKVKCDFIYDMSKVMEKAGVDCSESGYLMFYNSVKNPNYYKQSAYENIDIILLRDGYIRFDLDCDKYSVIGFRLSECLENSIDLYAEEEIQNEDMVFRDVKNGMTVYAPILAEALSKEAIIDDLNIGAGEYYAYVRYVFVGDVGEDGYTYINWHRYMNQNNMMYNKMYLKHHCITTIC